MGCQSHHLIKVHGLWKLLRQRRKAGNYTLDGNNLHIADVVATAQYVTNLYLGTWGLLIRRLAMAVNRSSLKIRGSSKLYKIV